MNEERLDWIENWLTDWDDWFGEDPLLPGDSSYYQRLPMEVAVAFGLELVNELKDNS